MDFRRPEHFVLMLLAMVAFLTLGRQRSRDLFKISIMGLFLAIAACIQRDAWCVVLPAIAVIADAVRTFHDEAFLSNRNREWRYGLPFLAGVVLISLSVGVLRLPSNDELMKSASRVFPANASEYIRTNQLPGPIFNDYTWGGFLTWCLPEYPVAIDGRLSLYGDETNERYFKLTGGTLRMEEDPSFSRAQTILLVKKSGLAQALTSLPVLRRQFRLVYEDKLAVVLVRISPGE
jgi:hypothetical protein